MRPIFHAGCAALAVLAAPISLSAQTESATVTTAEGRTYTPTPDPQAAAQAVPPAMPADASYQGGPYKGALTPPPETAMNKTYPVCTSKLQDSCRNHGGK